MRRTFVLLLVLAACDDDVPANPDLASRDLAAADLTAAFMCDPVAQDCPVKSDKCTQREGAMLGNPDVSVCVPAGTLAENQTCLTSGNNDAGYGFDECAQGLICYQVPDGQQCLKFCDSSTQCTKPRQFCAEAPYRILCVTSCTVQGTDCPVGLTCAASVEELAAGTRQPVCRVLGATAVGAGCAADTDCVANAYCAGTPKLCRTSCNTAHPCVSGTCMSLPNTTVTTALGFCQ